VDVRVWHDGQCSGGSTVPPYPSGDVLGSDDGRYWFYVVPELESRLRVTVPEPGLLEFGNSVTPVTISGPVPSALADAGIDYTISMPGYILEHGQATMQSGGYQIVFDAAELNEDFPNLDLVGRDSGDAGLADTVCISLLLQGRSASGPVYQANTVTFQGVQVFVGDAPPDMPYDTYLPMALR
jgi:hypothetical protein